MNAEGATQRVDADALTRLRRPPGVCLRCGAQAVVPWSASEPETTHGRKGGDLFLARYAGARKKIEQRINRREHSVS